MDVCYTFSGTALMSTFASATDERDESSPPSEEEGLLGHKIAHVRGLVESSLIEEPPTANPLAPYYASEVLACAAQLVRVSLNLLTVSRDSCAVDLHVATRYSSGLRLRRSIVKRPPDFESLTIFLLDDKTNKKNARIERVP